LVVIFSGAGILVRGQVGSSGDKLVRPGTSGPVPGKKNGADGEISGIGDISGIGETSGADGAGETCRTD